MGVHEGTQFYKARLLTFVWLQKLTLCQHCKKVLLVDFMLLTRCFTGSVQKLLFTFYTGKFSRIQHKLINVETLVQITIHKHKRNISVFPFMSKQLNIIARCDFCSLWRFPCAQHTWQMARKSRTPPPKFPPKQKGKQLCATSTSAARTQKLTRPSRSLTKRSIIYPKRWTN